jgi:DNA-binding response OmpR family regulator
MSISGTLLLISPDQLLFKSLSSMLPPDRLDIVHRSSAENAVTLISETSPSLVLLDKSLPKVNASHICREIRKTYEGFLMVVAEHYNELDELTAFEDGADDYVKKAVHAQILLARVKRLLKRAQSKTMAKEGPIFIGSLVVDPTRREVLVKDHRIQLTSTQFDLLWHLANNRGRVVSREDLNRFLYKKSYNGFDRSIDVYISRIRQKIGDNPSQPEYLKTVRGVGYLFADLG